MPPTVDFLPVATSGSANVDPQSNFNGSGYQENGFQTGFALPFQANKVWRQASTWAAVIANAIAQTLNVNVLDDGNITLKVSQLLQLIQALAATPRGSIVPFSSTPTFDLANGTVFEMTLTGSVSSSTLIDSVGTIPNYTTITFIFHQDGVGGRTLVWPASLPGSSLDPGANATTMQSFLIDAAGIWHALPAVG